MSAQSELASKTKRVPFKDWKVVTKDDKSRRVTPSVYTQEMLQSTEERFANNKEITQPRILELLDMSKSSQHKFSLVDIDQPLFQPYPSELVFQNYTAAQTYSLQLQLSNNDKVSRKVRLDLQDSDNFQVVGLKNDGCKVAPGMSASFYVCFTPQENKDYQHRLVFVTERERFEVPVCAIGPRAILDFRDEIHLPTCAVKYSTERTHFVRNIGNCTAKFMLQTQRPFSVTPTCGTLDVGESMQVTVDFNPMTVGDHSQDLILHYHTGEDVYISLYGVCEELNIQLQPDFVPLQKTFISLSTVHTVSFTNRYDIPLKYFWTIWPSLQEEAVSLLRDGLVLSQREEAERKRLLFQCESDPTAIHGLPQLRRALQEHRSQCLRDSGMTFSHSCITVEPAEGELWPNMTTQFFIVFKPEEAKICQQTIYFDVTGCESRLPLKVVGEAIGPQIQFNYNVMDMKNVFVGDKGSYEVELSNVGLIDAPFRLSFPDTSFGRCFSVSPQEGVVPAGACQILEVTFSSHILGIFSEDLVLTVTGQPEPPAVTFRGCVIGPTFHFNVLELDFGDVGFGFPKTLSCSLFNTSCVSMTICLRVLGDGLGPPSVSYDKQLSDMSRNNWQASAARGCHARPMELTISPASGSVAPMSEFPIEVTLCANTVKRYWLAMAVDVEGVGKEIGTLPINARCVVPDIAVETPLLNFQRCFLDYPYEQKVCLTNTGNVPTCYGVLDKEYEESPSIHYGSSAPRGVIYPQSSAEIPVFLLAKATGTLQHSLHIAVFGSDQPPLEVLLSCIGQGPTVHIQSSQLDFGKIRVLTDSTRLLQLLNQSPIPAYFTARMTCKKSFWRVEPSEGEVPPGGQLDLSVVANLKDTLRFEDRLEVSIQHNKTHTVPLSATGTGTTIISDRPFAPSLDLGTYFSPGSCQYHFKLTNQGLRTQRLYWRIDGSQQSKVGDFSGRTILPPISTSKKDTLGDGSPLREKTVFSLSPSRVELFPGYSVDMVLSGSSDSPKIVQERLICQAIIGSQSTNEQIMSVDITCRFVATMLSISPKQLSFYMSKATGESLTPLYEKLTLTNVSTRSLSLELLLVKPFSLCQAAGVHSSVTKQSLFLDEGGQAEFWICCDPGHYLDRLSRIIDEVLEVNDQGHPQQDLVKLHAEIHYPNLQFSSTTVDFGCVLNYTETRKEICITNCSPLPVTYRWAFQVDQKHRDMLKEVEIPNSPLNKPGSGTNSFVSLRPDADEQNNAWSAVGAFDILPNFGHLQPGEKQKVALCFYAQENVTREITALCHVEEGPTYELNLIAEASVINYSLDPTCVDFGRQLFDHETEANVTLRNTGKVGFKFSIFHPDMDATADEEEGGPEMDDWPDVQQQKQLKQSQEGQDIWPGRPVVIPATGYIEAGAEQSLRVLYLPGFPDVFEKQLELKVAFLPPQVITLTGEGIFPRISLNLPPNLSDECYNDVVQQARSAVESDEVLKEVISETTTGGLPPVETNATLTYEGLLHMEIERRLVKENALAVIAGLLELGDSPELPKKWHKLSKFLLPEYVLDFGYVILGQVLTHTVTVTNTGSVAVSFQANLKVLAGTGFAVEFEQVKNLPCGETQTFIVKFDSQGSSQKMGDISVVMPIQVLHGPTVQVLLCAVVTEPSLTVSTDNLQFDTIQCGMCQMRTIQLYNHKSVPCWWSIAEEVTHVQKVDKFLPFYQRKKLLQQLRPPPAVFEMTPCSGMLSTGERVNVQIKFSPAEGLAYNRHLVISMADSSHQIYLTAQGEGADPQLEFWPSELALGPCLPNSTHTEAEVTVKNPCSFPIEFYSLEFDTQYLEEEKLLSVMQGYDEKNMLLLPPRGPGESLPEELREYYTDYCSQLNDKAKQKESVDGSGKNDANAEDSDIVKRQEEGVHATTLKAADLLLCNIPKEGSSEKQGQLEITPVVKAIARHMSIDLSPEGFAARNRRGISVIVYGAPLTGKSGVASALAQHYGGVCLSVDNVVTAVLMNGSSAVSLRARQLYDTAAAQYLERKAKEAALPVDEIRKTGSTAVTEATDAASRSAPASSMDAPTKLSRKSSKTISKSAQRATEPHSALWLGGDVTTLRNILPEQVLVDILAERFQQTDCHRGIVISGLESVYTSSVSATLQVVLKALNNRKHIYVVNLSCSYAVLKARERSRREAEEALLKGKAANEENWWQELDEEEYDVLPEEEKEHLIERYRVKLRQIKLRELERTQREQQDKILELEMKKMKEEELKKKSKKPGKKDPKEATRRKNLPDGKQSSTDATRKSSGSNSKESLVDARETPSSNEVQYSKEADEENKGLQTTTFEPVQTTEKPMTFEKPKTGVDELQLQFNAYEQSKEQVEHILQHWDRALLLLLVPIPNEDAQMASEEAVSEKRASQSKKSKKASSKVISPVPSQVAALADSERRPDKMSPREIIPHIVLNVKGEDCPSVTELLKMGTLPSLDQLLDDMGIGPSGPPIPPPTTLSIVPFPKTRQQAERTCDCFTFLVPSKPDESKRDSEEDEQSPIKDERATTPFRARGKGSAATRDQGKKGRESQKSKRRSRVSSASTISEPSQANHQASLEQKRQLGLTSFRWIVPANGEISLRVWFYRDSPGKFEQTFNFELLGTRRNYQLQCTGICSYPSICTDYITLFPNCKAVSQRQEGLRKTYVVNPGYFEFGPLLCGKTRDRFKETKYQENTEKLLIHNNSGLEAEVHFQFQQDTQASTYLVDPATMTLKPDEKQEVTVWAYPTKLGLMRDSLICSIKENPELITIDFSCWGVRPELKMDSRHYHFDRILLHRQDSRTVTLRNRTALPVSWRLQGVEELGDEFSVPQDHGIIQPKSSLPVTLHFRAKRPLHIKKVLRLEVSDVEKILGIVHTETIQVSAEAYDIALDISPDGLLDFGTMRVFEENKLSLKMKNQGKYEIAYKFIFPQTDIAKSNLLSVSPKNGALKPLEKSTTVQIVCSPTKEVCIKEKPLLSCEVIEPSIGKGGETIAILAIKVSVKSVFSRYKITPACDINFGPLVYGNRKSQALVIKNVGVFETQFTISRMILDPALMERPGGQSKRLTQGSQSERASGTNGTGRRESFQKEARPAQSILTMGVFTVAPCLATLQPGGQQVVTVNCAAEQLGKWNLGLLIDISDRDPTDHPSGIPYRLLAEICKPGILLDVASIFEEHYLCPNSSHLTSEKFCNAKGIYIQEENKFLFNKVLVGQTARARFKLTNNSKVPCVLNFTIKHVAARTLRNVEVFELTTPTLNIPSQSHAFAEVSFTPQTIQLYNAVFEVTMEGASRMTPPFRSKLLEFDLVGEGNLPSVCVLRPSLRSREGSPMLQFRRVLVGHRHTLPLVLLNDGIVPAQVQLDLVDEHEVFTLKASLANTGSSVHFTTLEGTAESEGQLVHRAVIGLSVNEHVELEVSFCSDKPLNLKAKMLLQVADNQYNETAIQVSGEAYQEVVSLSNISRSLEEADLEEDEEGNYEVLNFGHCYVGCPYQESFTMTNHTDNQVVKFEWPSAGPQISFSPQVGHIHAGCSKEVTVTFCASKPVNLSSRLIKCKICQVEFQQPLEQVIDWDDRQRTVQWLDSPEPTPRTPEQHGKNKVINTDPEPSCTVIAGSQWELELCIKAVCDYVQFSCNTEAIHFNDTMLYQTRLYQLQIVNQGKVKFEYSFQVCMDSSTKTAIRDQEDESVTSRPCSRAAESTEARPASALASVISVLTTNPALPPFTIEPSIGTVEPGAVQQFNIRFAPLEVAQFEGRLVCSIPNLQDEYQAPCIPLFGRCLLPYCHFDLEDSDYFGAICCTREFKGLLDSNTRIIEFNAVGVSQPSTRCFSVLNPTSKSYSFKWKCEDTGGCPFHCLTPSGSIQPGKKVEARFEYIPEQIEVVAQSSWSFVIETLSLSVPFLCMGTSREPLVYLNKPYLNFGEILVGQRVEQIMDLVNAEEQSFSFFVVQSSLLCDDQQSSLTVHPMTGTVASKDKLPLSVRLTPCRDGHVSFKMVLRVKRKTDPLVITVKADCFAMSASLQVSMPGEELRDVNPNHPDTLDFGKVEISENHISNFLLTNLARFSLDVSLDVTGPCELLQYLEATPKKATTDIGKQLQLSLSFCPRNVCNLQNVILSIKVRLGPTFVFAVKGRAVAPSLEFSVTKHNFGKCFLYRPGMVPASHTLLLSNKGEKGISVQSPFKDNAYLEMDFQPDIVPPGAVVEVPIYFYPRELCHYHKKITFIFNSCITREVDIMGQGVEMKLEVEDLKHRKVKLRCMMVGQKVKKQVKLINRSPIDVSFTLLVTNTLLDPKDLSVSPAGELSLKANGGACKIEILFSPRHHIPSFTAELQADCAGLLHPLLSIQGCCQGVKVHLAQDRLAFGAVVQRCHSKKRIVMINTGDIGGRFQWKTGNFPPELSITPTKGYICPGMEVPFEVTFAPVQLSEDIRYENLSCFVEGTSSPVTLTVTGSCIVASTSKEVVNFVCPVRGFLTQTLNVTNPTNQQCTISPVIEGEQWSAAPSMIFEPLQNKAYRITYRPLTMTADGQKHQGSVFFSFPDGTGMLYSLQGTTEPPKAEDTIVHQLPAKTHHTQLLTVHNWLSKQQRFHVLIEFLKPEKPDATVSLKGVEYIDVPALAKREYKMSFYTYREGQYQTKVTFRNEASGEYMFYLVTFDATSPGALSTIKLVTAVRRVASASVGVENPLSTPVCFTTECRCPDISAPPQTTVPGQSKGFLNFEYQPLRAGDFTVRLSLCNVELGFFHFDLVLRALPPPPEKTVYFTAYLGSSHSVYATFINYSRIKTEYACRIDSPDFFVDRSVSASPGFQAGSETSVEVCFEPHKLGEVKGQLNLSSGFGGEYIFPLHGVCLPPKAQGPFSIRSGRHITIPFKNVFLQTTAFSFQVDKPYFNVRGVEPIPSKKTQNILVAFEVPLDGSQGPWLGKMTVSSQRSEGHSKPCSWVFYLRGYHPSSA